MHAYNFPITTSRKNINAKSHENIANTTSRENIANTTSHENIANTTSRKNIPNLTSRRNIPTGIVVEFREVGRTVTVIAVLLRGREV